MALKIRLRQQGRRNQYTYRVVVTDSRSPRDGKYIEMIGHYDPYVEGNKSIVLKEDRIDYWISKGAQPTEKMEKLIKRGAPGAMKNLRTSRAKAQLRKRKKKPAK